MTYQEFQQELQKKEESELYQSLETVREAIGRCAPETRSNLTDWAGNLDRLTTAADEAEYDAAREGVFQGLNELINDYRAPEELFADAKVRAAMGDLFSALELRSREFDVPGFTIGEVDRSKPAYSPSENAARRRTVDKEKARLALERDPLGYAAQFMATMSLREKASPSDMFDSLERVAKWKKDPALRLTAADKTTMGYLADGASESYESGFLAKREEAEKNSRSFKGYSDWIAMRYRKRDIDYPELELEMRAIRELTKDAVAEETDPVKRSRQQEETWIYMPDFKAKVKQLRLEAKLGQQTASAEAYQQELAASSPLSFDDRVHCIEEVYGATPVFHPEFAIEGNTGYNRENFDRYLPEVDTSGFVVGGTAVSNEEFASLAALAVYDPDISGVHAIGPEELIDIPSDVNMSITFHGHRVSCFGNQTTQVDGKDVRSPDYRAGKFIPTEVGPAREKVKEALLAYQAGDRGPLAKIIAFGVRCGTDESWHELDKREEDPRLAAVPDSPVQLTLTGDDTALSKLMEGALTLLERDPELAQAAKAAGLTDEHRKKAAGLLRGYQAFKAGEAALERLLGAVMGGEQLSDFEREQCALALHRRNALMQSMKEYKEELEPQRKKIDKAFDDRLKDIQKKYGVENMRDPNCMAEMQKAQAFWGRQVFRLNGTPPVYRRLGADGVYALDMIAVEQRVGKEKAEWMTSREAAQEIAADRERLRRMSPLELAAELGAVPPQSGRTTAQDVYDRLTKDYKAGKMEYVLYEARLKTMRELTGGNKRAKIDLETIDASIEYRLRRSEASRAPLEKAITQMTEATFEGPLGARLRGIYDVYGLTPKPCKASLENGKYAQETFDLLRDFQAQPGETHLKLAKFGPPLSNDDFAALAAAVTQTYPEIGGIFFVQDKKTGVITNAVEQPTLDHAITARTVYMTDAYRDAQGARKGFDDYLKAVVAPAREKAIEALRQFNGGKGSAAELGKILGTGLHNMLDSFLLMPDDQDIRGDCALEAAVSGRLADIISRNPDLEEEACKYVKKEELETARGLKIVYDFTRAAQDAEYKLKTAVNTGIPLPETEKQACVELLLRQRAMVLSARQDAKEKYTDEKIRAIEEEYLQADTSTDAKDALVTMRLAVAQGRCVGIPDYVRMLGIKGPDFAREMLDAAMPGREAFFAKSEAEILAAMGSKIGSREDPFQNSEYTKAFNEEKALTGALRHERQKSAPQAGGGVKAL